MEKKKDIAAIELLTQLSRQWRNLSNLPSDVALEAIILRQAKVNSILKETEDGLELVKTYVESIREELSSTQKVVKESLIHTVEIMKDLANRLVPEQKTGTRQNENKRIAEMLQTHAQMATQQQNLASLLESVSNVCQIIENSVCLESGDIRKLQKDINSYGDTLENEKERKEREEKKAREKQKREEAERKRKDAEEKLRNPENWSPLIMRDPKAETGFVETDIHCVIYAMSGSVSDSLLQSKNMDKSMKPKEWLNIPYEQQASSPLIITYKGNMPLDLKIPMEIYVPFVIENIKYEPEVKICIDNGSWEYADIITERKVHAFPKGVKYIGTKIQKFQSFKFIVVGVSQKKAISVDDVGHSFKEGSMEFVFPPSTFGKTCNVKLGVSQDPGSDFNNFKNAKDTKENMVAAQVHVDLDCRNKTKKDISVNISTEKLESQFKENMTAQKVLLDLHQAPDVPKTFRIDPFLDELSKMNVIDKKDAKDNKNMKKADEKLKHLFELLCRKPSDLEQVLGCLDKSGNREMAKKIRQRLEESKEKRSAEEKHRPVMVYRVQGGKWNVLDPKTSARLHKKMGCTLPAGHRYFEFMSLAVPEASTDTTIQLAAEKFRNEMLGTTVTLLCRQKEDDQGDTFIHILPTQHAKAELSRLKGHGYTRGPMELPDFTVADGETIQLHMSGNVGIEHNSIRKGQGEMLIPVPFKVNKDVSKLNCRMYVVDKNDQLDDEKYRGVLHYQIKALEPMGHRSDSVEITWEKLTKGYLSQLSINGEIQALAKFIGLRMKNKDDIHAIFSTMDKPAVVEEIEARVAKTCKDESDQVKCETTIFIWANQNQNDNKEKSEHLPIHYDDTYHIRVKDRLLCYKMYRANIYQSIMTIPIISVLKKDCCVIRFTERTSINPLFSIIQIKIILHAVKSYPWATEAERFVSLYTDKGMFSEMSLLTMSELIRRDWKDLAVYLKIPEVQVSYIESLKLTEQKTKGKLLDKYRLSNHAIQQGENLPHEFVRCLKECKCSETLLTYVQGKLK